LELGPKRVGAGEKAKEIARRFDAVLGGHDARRAGEKRQASERKRVEKLEWDFDRFTHRSFLLAGCAAGVAAGGSSRPCVRHFFEQKCTVTSCPSLRTMTLKETLGRPHAAHCIRAIAPWLQPRRAV
jgi:hypothetical protein